MKGIFKSIIGALTIAGALTATVPAQARHDGYRDYREYRWKHGHRGYRDHGWRDYRRYDRYGYGDRRHYRHYPRRYYGYRGYPRVYYRDYDNDGAIIAAGIIGLALGAAIASDRDRGDRYYRDHDYYRD